jgi:phage terminase small subunit
MGTKATRLRPQHQKFVDAIVVDPTRNQTKAAIAAGYAVKGAHVRACELMAREDVRAAVNRRIDQASMRSQLTIERVQEEIARVAFSNPKRLFDESTGELKPLHELGDDDAAAIASIDNEELYEGTGKDRERTGTVKKLKLWDKGRALELAAKHLGMVREATQLQVGALTIIIGD